jgi:hypothetical protein
VITNSKISAGDVLPCVPKATPTQHEALAFAKSFHVILEFLQHRSAPFSTKLLLYKIKVFLTSLVLKKL